MIKVQFDITTDASGDYSHVSTDTPRNLGPLLLYALEWLDTDFDAGVDAVLSYTSPSTGTSHTLLTLTNADAEAVYYPQALKDDNAGADTTEYTPQIVDGPLKLVVSSGGNAKTGKAIAFLIEV